MKDFFKKHIKSVMNDKLYSTGVVMWWKVRNFISRYHYYEPEDRILYQFIREGDWVVDLGVNMAQYTTKMASLVGKQGKVIGFEPDPGAFLLAKRIFPNPVLELYPFAASDTDDDASMALFFDNSGNLINGLSAVITDHEAFRKVCTHQTEFITVPCRKLDDILENRTRKISFIKCDIQGHELEAITGALNIIDRDRPVLLIEITKKENFELINQMLSPYHYRSFRYNGKSLVETDTRIASNNYFFILVELSETGN